MKKMRIEIDYKKEKISVSVDLIETEYGKDYVLNIDTECDKIRFFMSKEIVQEIIKHLNRLEKIFGEKKYETKNRTL